MVVLVVAKKSRTCSSLPYSADEWVCRSWQGAEPDGEAKLANGKSLHHRCHAQVAKAGFAGGRNPFFFKFSCLSLVGVRTFVGGWSFSQSLASYMDFVSLAKSVKFVSLGNPAGSAVAAQELAASHSLGREKMVLHIVCFAYSLSLPVVLVLVFPLLSY